MLEKYFLYTLSAKHPVVLRSNPKHSIYALLFQNKIVKTWKAINLCLLVNCKVDVCVWKKCVEKSKQKQKEAEDDPFTRITYFTCNRN